MTERRPANIKLPSGPRNNAKVEDLKSQLEALKRETSQMAAMESSIKWEMKRDEEKHRRNEKQMDAKEHFQAKDQDAAADRRLRDLKKKTDKMRENQDSKDYQVFKKVYKAEERAVDLEQITDAYIDAREASAWNMELRRTVPQAERRDRIEANLEQFQTRAMYSLEEQQREKVQRHEDRVAGEQEQLEHAMLEAQIERESALRALEYARACKNVEVSPQQHLAGKP